MSTTASIAKVEKDGTVTSIYCNFDGDLECVGRILFENYTDEDKVDNLLRMGDVSSLGQSLEAPEAIKRFKFNALFSDEYRSLPEDEQKRLKDEMFDFSHSIFYKRDNGEQTSARTYSSVREWFDSARENYNYLFDTDGTWKYVTHRGRIKQIHLADMSDVLDLN